MNNKGLEIQDEKILDIMQDFLLATDISMGRTGYGCLCSAVLLAYRDEQLLYFVTKGLYPEVAQANNTTPKNAEQSIRRVLRMAYNSGKLAEEINKTFGREVLSPTKRPKPVEVYGFLIRYVKKKLAN